MALQKVVLASNNAGKLREFSAMLEPVGLQMIAQGELGVPEAAEPFHTFVENALAKARHASAITGLPALADDSGLSVRALDGAPGVYSARFASMAGGEKSDAANNAHLVSKLQGVSQRDARYVALLVFVRHAEDPCPIICEGFWEGKIVDQPQGENGFGYDPHFFLPDLGKTAAQLSSAEKNSVSHRAIALKQLLQRLQHEGWTC
ncbi:RdgB/HAM1 family non-canonical purine NTP pyrophosphatase [Paenalcaligenes sp. Me131]|uniref:RdgB/HAM1 family non-canonical purine NTP pyrophosphatase n=1 Tax=Paenalcaligenes sp. Me131 TaxID=3392636 RepID=UPI003D26CDF4